MSEPSFVLVAPSVKRFKAQVHDVPGDSDDYHLCWCVKASDYDAAIVSAMNFQERVERVVITLKVERDAVRADLDEASYALTEATLRFQHAEAERDAAIADFSACDLKYRQMVDNNRQLEKDLRTLRARVAELEAELAAEWASDHADLRDRANAEPGGDVMSSHPTSKAAEFEALVDEGEDLSFWCEVNRDLIATALRMYETREQAKGVSEGASDV